MLPEDAEKQEAYYLAKAEEADLKALEAKDSLVAETWRTVAASWRLVARGSRERFE